MKSLFPIILIVVAVGLFFFQVNPLYGDIKTLRTESSQYDEALKIADQLTDLRSELSTKLDSFSQADLDRLDHFLPNKIDTVRVILDVDGIASRDSVKLRNLNIIDATPKDGGKAGKSPYNTLDVSFSFTSSYAQGIKFIQDIQSSLRLLDVSKAVLKNAKDNSGQYDFDMTLSTYWINR